MEFHSHQYLQLQQVYWLHFIDCICIITCLIFITAARAKYWRHCIMQGRSRIQFLGHDLRKVRLCNWQNPFRQAAVSTLAGESVPDNRNPVLIHRSKAWSRFYSQIVSFLSRNLFWNIFVQASVVVLSLCQASVGESISTLWSRHTGSSWPQDDEEHIWSKLWMQA